jgi:3-oxoacyl-[acyl-carrier protein] reductase
VFPIDLRGKRALVTGGSRGVGAATVRLLAAAGADVVFSYLGRSAAAEAVVADVRGEGRRCFAEAGDLTDAGAVDRLFRRVGRELGGLDILVANAGIWPPEDVALADLPMDRWRRTLAVNLDAVFLTLRAGVPALAEQGRVVVVGSTAGQRGEAYHADYAASKGALSALVKGLAIELAPRGITVNCVAPGWIDTEMAGPAYAGAGRARVEATVPLGRIATPEDVAGPILFLCSLLARHITGEVMNVNGGSVLCG